MSDYYMSLMPDLTLNDLHDPLVKTIIEHLRKRAAI